MLLFFCLDLYKQCVVHCGAMVHVLFLMLIENNLQKTVKKEMLAVSVM